MVPYRENATREPPVAELAYVPAERQDQRGGFLPAFQLVGLPAAVGGALWIAWGPEAGLASLALIFALNFWIWNRRPRDGATLRIEHGELRVYPLGSKEPSWRISVGDLDDVVLETKTVERIVEGGSVNLGATYLNPRIAPATDTNRIVLEGRRGASFPLSKAYLGHSDSLEWFGKIRVFLRKCGWTPETEREPVSEE